MSFFSQSPRRGRTSQAAKFLPGTAGNFSPGQFARTMPQAQQRVAQPPTANPPFAVADPVQVKRPSNAQLGSSTPMSQPAFTDPGPTNPNTTPINSYPLGTRGIGGTAPTPTMPVRPGYGDIGTPEPMPPPQTTPPMTMPSEGFPMNRERFVRPTQPMPDPVTPVQRPNRAPADPGFVPPSASWYDRSGAGPGMGAVTDLASQMAVKAQTGMLTAADALAAEQAGDPALAAAIRNAVAGLGWNYSPQMNDNQTQAVNGVYNAGQQVTTQPARRPYRVFTSPSAGGIYTG